MFPQLFGKYVLERELASGGMAIVYLATLRGAGGFEKRLVVKQIRAELASDEAFVRRFVAEAKTTVELSHPNIVPVYELGVEQGVYFIAMELAKGVTLSELLKVGGPLSPEEGAYLGVEICRALDYAHRRSGIVHRDVTPRNVIIDDEGAVRLIDFGIAAPVSVDGSPRERVFGSPGHMPLEQLQGGRLTPATDVFAVAALLIEAWTGEPPFRRATREESDAALSAVGAGVFRRALRLAPLDDLIVRAVAQQAAVRPQSAEELARPLRDFLRTADLGDIARRVGERVRRARRTSIAEASAPQSGTPVTPIARPTTRSGSVPPPMTPATRPITQPVTETFASRDEVEEWIRAPSTPPPADQPSRTEAAEPARAPSSTSGRPAANAAEPPSTAPLGVADAAKEGISQRRRRPWLELTIALVLALFGVATLRNGVRVAPQDPPPVDRRAPSHTAASASRAELVTTRNAEATGRGATPPPTESMPPATPVVTGSVAVVKTPPVRTPAPSGAVAAGSAPDVAATPAPSAEEAKSAAATFTVTADLPARVTIDGAPVGATPIRGVKRPAGRHVVGLASVELDERLSTTVDAEPGATLAIHAEFTRPVPVLRVH